MPYPTTGTTLLGRLNRDEAAWEEFFDRYRQVVADIGCYKGLSPEECSDLVQEVMLRFHRKVEAGFRYDPSLAKFRTFFSRLIKGCVYDLIRRRDRHCIPVADPPDSVGSDRPDELLDMALLEKWRSIIREEAMLELARRVGEKTFQAFELYAIEERSADETAALVGLSVNSVYVAKSRCAKILREIIRQLNAEDPELKLNE